MLYARRPPNSSISEWDWDRLIRQAAELLDELDKAYVRVEPAAAQSGRETSQDGKGIAAQRERQRAAG